jgi:hypothetical protein
MDIAPPASVSADQRASLPFGLRMVGKPHDPQLECCKAAENFAAMQKVPDFSSVLSRKVEGSAIKKGIRCENHMTAR